MNLAIYASEADGTADYHLPSRHANSLDREFPSTHVEEIL